MDFFPDKGQAFSLPPPVAQHRLQTSGLSSVAYNILKMRKSVRETLVPLQNMANKNKEKPDSFFFYHRNRF